MKAFILVGLILLIILNYKSNRKHITTFNFGENSVNMNYVKLDGTNKDIGQQLGNMFRTYNTTFPKFVGKDTGLYKKNYMNKHCSLLYEKIKG
jgi:hypothetical protein